MGPEAWKEAMQTVKVTHCGQTKRREFARADLTYESLCAWLTTAFGVTVDGVTPPIPRIVYRDPEGDLVSVSSTTELLDAVGLVASNSALVLQLTFPRPRERWYRHAAAGSFGNLDFHATDNDVETPVEAKEAQEPRSEGADEISAVEPSAAAPAICFVGKPSKEEMAARRQAIVAWSAAVDEARQNGTDLPPHPFLGMNHPIHHRFAIAQAKKTARVAARAASAQDECGATSPSSALPAASDATAFVGKPSKEEMAARRQALVAWRTAVAEARQNGTDLPPHPFLGMNHPIHHRFAIAQAKKTARTAARAVPAQDENDAIPTPPDVFLAAVPDGAPKTEYTPNSVPLLAYPMWAPCKMNSGETGAGVPTASSDQMLLFVPSLGKVFAPVHLPGNPNATGSAASATDDAVEHRRPGHLAKKTARLARFG